MASVVIQGDTSGSVTLQAPAVAGSTTVNLPSTIGNAGTSAVVTTDASGDVGIGVTPSAWGSGRLALQVGGSTTSYLCGTNPNTIFGSNNYNDGTNTRYINNGNAANYIQTSGEHRWLTATSGTAGNIASFTQVMTVDANGSLLVGTTAPTYSSSTRGLIEVNGSNDALIALKRNNASNFYLQNDPSAVYVQNTANTPLVFSTNNSERGRFTAGGYFKASDNGAYTGGSTSAVHEFNQSANNNSILVFNSNASLSTTGIFWIEAARNTTNNTFYALSYYNSGAAAYKLRIADSGNVTNTNGSYGTISDAKMKTDIVDAGSQWDDIKAVRFRKFKMKDDPDQIVQLGVVAQELEQTSPGLVEEHKDTDKDGNDLGTTTKSVKTSVLLMKAAVALQEAMLRIENLETEIAALKAAGSN